MFVACVVANEVKAQLSTDWVLFESFVTSYDKEYVNDSAEIAMRFGIFQVLLL